MRTVEDLIGLIKGRDIIIIGAGSSIQKYYNQINKFIKDNDVVTFGINNMTHYWTPYLHLWTNTQRFRSYGKNISPESKLLLGQNIPLKLINSVIGNHEYFLINYTDMNKNIPIGYRNGKIYGYYRTAGCLAVMIAYLMGAEKISIVGMDGYTLYDKDKLMSFEKSQHCYGKGFTDTADYETCIKKDIEINNVLCSLKACGIGFNILTPTKYREFYKKVW